MPATPQMQSILSNGANEVFSTSKIHLIGSFRSKEVLHCPFWRVLSASAVRPVMLTDLSKVRRTLLFWSDSACEFKSAQNNTWEAFSNLAHTVKQNSGTHLKRISRRRVLNDIREEPPSRDWSNRSCMVNGHDAIFNLLRSNQLFIHMAYHGGVEKRKIYPVPVKATDVSATITGHQEGGTLKA